MWTRPRRSSRRGLGGALGRAGPGRSGRVGAGGHGRQLSLHAQLLAPDDGGLARLRLAGMSEEDEDERERETEGRAAGGAGDARQEDGQGA